MKKQDLALIGSTALVTSLLTASALLIHPLHADDASAKEVAEPRFVADGIEFTLAATDHRVFKAGDEPEFVLKASNPGSSAAEASIEIVMAASSPASRLSRMAILPAPLWRHPYSLTLNPHETKTIPLATGTKLPPNQIIEVMLRPANPQVLLVGTNATPTPPSLLLPNPFGVTALTWSTMEQPQSTLVTAR